MEERRLELAVLQQDAAIKAARLAMSPVVTLITDAATGMQTREERERPAKDVQALAMASAILTDKAELLMSRITTQAGRPPSARSSPATTNGACSAHFLKKPSPLRRAAKQVGDTADPARGRPTALTEQ